MKLECVKLNLKDALLTAERFTGKRASLPVLRYVLFIAGEKSLKLRATNLEMGIEIELPARVEKEGVIAIPADTLGNFLSNLPSEKNVTIEQVEGNLLIAGSTYSTVIKGFPYEDFPTLPFVTKGTSFEIESQQLVEGFRATQFSVALSMVKPEFASVYVYTEEGMLVLVATDSSRLGEKRVTLKNAPEGLSMLIPGTNAIELVRALEGANERVSVVATKNQVTFSTEHIHITSRLVDGVFPDYHQIVPKKFTTEVILLRQDLVDRLRMTTVFSGKLQQVRLKIYPQEKLFEVESRNDEIGETSQQVEATLSGEPVEFLLNQRFLNDVLSYLSTDSVTLSASGAGKPLVVRGVGDHSFLYLLMPMRG